MEETEDNILVDPHSLVDGRWEESGQYQWEEGNYELRVGFFEKNGELEKSLGLEELNNLAVSKNKYEDKYSRDILQVMKRSKGR